MSASYELGRLARDQATRLCSDHVGSVHFILALLLQPDLRASKILVSAGITADLVEAELTSKSTSTEHSNRSYPFDISEFVADPVLRKRVLESKQSRPLTSEMTEVLTLTRALPAAASPELIVARILRHRTLVAPQLIRAIGADPEQIADQLDESAYPE